MRTFLELQAMEAEAAKHDQAASAAASTAERCEQWQKSANIAVNLHSNLVHYGINEGVRKILDQQLPDAVRDILRIHELKMKAVAETHRQQAAKIRAEIEALILQPIEGDQP